MLGPNVGDRLELEISLLAAARFRLVSAYVVKALTSMPGGAKTPAALECSADLNFRYAATQDEIDGRWLFAGVQPFTSIGEGSTSNHQWGERRSCLFARC